jgi:hypothetical protein
MRGRVRSELTGVGVECVERGEGGWERGEGGRGDSRQGESKCRKGQTKVSGRMAWYGVVVLLGLVLQFYDQSLNASHK